MAAANSPQRRGPARRRPSRPRAPLTAPRLRPPRPQTRPARRPDGKRGGPEAGGGGRGSPRPQALPWLHALPRAVPPRLRRLTGPGASAAPAASSGRCSRSRSCSRSPLQRRRPDWQEAERGGHNVCARRGGDCTSGSTSGTAGAPELPAPPPLSLSAPRFVRASGSGEGAAVPRLGLSAAVPEPPLRHSPAGWEGERVGTDGEV